MSQVTDAIQDLQDRADENDQNVSDFQDNTNQTLDDHTTAIDDAQQRAGQLDFPLTPESIDRIKEVFPTGTATLVAGTKLVNDPRINSSSIIIYSVATVGGTPGTLSYVLGNGTLTFNSTNAADTSTINYVIF